MARVEKPDGSFLELRLLVYWAHFNIRNPEVSIDQRWRLAFTFPDATKAEVPLKSKIYVSAADYAMIANGWRYAETIMFRFLIRNSRKSVHILTFIQS